MNGGPRSRRQMYSSSRQLCIPGGLQGNFLEACTPKPFILGEECELCRISRGAALIPEKVEITDGDGDASAPIARAILGGLYIREDYVPEYMSIRPRAQFLVPTVRHRSLRAMTSYRRLVEGGLLELDETHSQIAFKAVCKRCGRLAVHLEPECNETIQRSCQRYRANSNFTVTEGDSTDLVFRASKVNETGMFRWECCYLFDPDVVTWMLGYQAFAPRYETVRAQLIL